MATNEVPRGPVSRYVIKNVTRLRESRGWSFPRLSEELGKVGRPILPTGLHRLENGKRRVDVDDLVALAAAFGVSPITLLLPYVADGSIELTDELDVDAKVAWDWMQARRPLDVPDDEDAAYAVATFRRASLPKGIRQYPPTAAGREMLGEDYPEMLPRERTVAEVKEALDGKHQEAP